MKNKIPFLLFFCFTLTLTSQMALAHGEDKPGPHGGHIKMPGGFHTEVKLEKDNLIIYLLDEKFENPTVTDSKVEVSFNTVKNKFIEGCNKPQKAETTVMYFTCPLPKTKEKIKSISVWAVRLGMKGNEAVYHWPLRFEKMKKSDTSDSKASEKTNSQHEMDHSGHH